MTLAHQLLCQMDSIRLALIFFLTQKKCFSDNNILLMNELISNNLMLVLNSVLLGLFFSVFLFGCYRSITAEGKNKSFLIKFFGIVTVIAAIECALQNY